MPLLSQTFPVLSILFALFTAENVVKNYRFLPSKLTVIGSPNNRLPGKGKNRVGNTSSTPIPSHLPQTNKQTNKQKNKKTFILFS
jgi:hypothetical protein